MAFNRTMVVVDPPAVSTSWRTSATSSGFTMTPGRVGSRSRASEAFGSAVRLPEECSDRSMLTGQDA